MLLGAGGCCCSSGCPQGDRGLRGQVCHRKGQQTSCVLPLCPLLGAEGAVSQTLQKEMKTRLCGVVPAHSEEVQSLLASFTVIPA